MKQLKKLIALGMLIFAIGCNLWVYRNEPTALIDPNDNAFQYALIDRTNQMWDFAWKTCSINPVCFTSYLVDHWVPNWAQGYNLPFYYSHIPQILIVFTFKLIGWMGSMSLFTYYHIVIYLLMCIFPLSVFLALRVIKLPWLAAGIGAILASQISTDGLYGLDPPSFLFRGWGLSSQLFAMIWLPLSIAYAYQFFAEPLKKESRRTFLLAIFFLTATAMGHLGIGIIVLLSLIPLGIAQPLLHIFNKDRYEALTQGKANAVKLVLLGLVVVFFLSYWIVPIFLTNDYHNVSFWDPVWKFDSFGWRLTMDRLFNGELFDWGRFPWLTILVFIGIFVSLGTSYASFAFLFVFWLLLYFGRATWGGLIDLIPGMSEFHLSRFIVGIHLASLFLVPIGVDTLISRVRKIPSLLSYAVVIVLIVITLYPQTLRYAAHNDFLIDQANQNYASAKPEFDSLMNSLRELQAQKPGRIYAGRGGNWGKEFKIAETPYFMELSTFGLPLVLWLPETWSPNSDTEQFFSEDVAAHYELYNITYVVAPPSVTPQSFWKLLKESESWNIYEVETSGYVTGGVRPAIVATDKLSYVNVVRLWIQSDQTHQSSLYPEITFAKDYPKKTGLPNFKMIDEAMYQIPDGSIHSLFAEPPAYMSETSPDIKILSQSNESDMIFKTTVEVGENCVDCIVILRESSHPNWQVTIDGKRIDHINVFPFFVAVPVPARNASQSVAGGTTGTHEIVFSYEPSGLKIFLLVIEIVAGISLIFLARKHLSGLFRAAK